MGTNLTHQRGRGATQRGMFATLALLLMLFFAFSGTLPAQQLASDKGQQAAYPAAVSGDYAIVGAQWHDSFSGAAYIFKRDGSNWVEHQKLAPADLGRFDHFGSSVAISGDYAFVATTWQDTFKGAVYVYKRTGNTWIEQEKLTDSQGTPDDQFGHTVTISGDLVTIGSRLTAVAEPGAGVAYRFERRGDTWAEQPTVSISNTVPVEPVRQPGQISRVLNAFAAMTGSSTDVIALAAGPPPAPASVTASDATFEDRVEIAWSKVPLSAIIYKILRDGQLLSVVSSDDSLYTDRTGVPGTVYNYCVVVKDMAGLESTPVCDNGSRIIFPPQAVAASDGQFVKFVRITWKDLSKIESGYRIKRDGELIAELPADATRYDDEDAVQGDTYSYQVIAFDASNNESQAVADNGFRGFILAPKNVSATDGQFPDRVRITWVDRALTHKKSNRVMLLRGSLPHNLCNPKFEATNYEQRLQTRISVGHPIPISGSE